MPATLTLLGWLFGHHGERLCVCVCGHGEMLCACVCEWVYAENGRGASAGLSSVQCVLVPLTDVRTRASSSLSMIRAVAANHVVRKDSMQATCRGDLQSSPW